MSLSQDKLHACRQFIGTLTYKDNIVNHNVYAVKGLRKPLIGHPAITVLKLVFHVNTIQTYQQKIVNRFPKGWARFKGLDMIEEEYEIVLKIFILNFIFIFIFILDVGL